MNATAHGWVPPSHVSVEMDGLVRSARVDRIIAREAEHARQRAAGLERDRQEAIAAGWPVATDPPTTKARTTPRTPPRAPRHSSGPSGPSGGRTAPAVPLPPGSLVLSAPEVAALDALLATPEVRRLLGAR